ncbi:hypothetical protein ES332_A02G093000v1 [Gossypium tomentosum]|uniref:C2 NT-type domain-containing protein n=1 Tax=Gossypium tomentosum TaxID=34277 RepID=A0A5D2REY5_GOSTO|nr:hypothetical protein ES332_A02G093000v1 [Gossypium tomentosum]
MSRITKWKIEKSKVKFVFWLQFHATHIPQSGWDKLYISFVPADSGKTTVKTTKANVRNGTCKWADPVYETTRLLQDIKTKQFDGKLYKLVAAMYDLNRLLPKLFGRVPQDPAFLVNLSDYVDASKPSVVSLPLLGCDSGATLHVTVQLLTSKTGFREFEQQRELSGRGLQVDPDQNGPDQSYSGKVSVSEEIVNNRIDKFFAFISHFYIEPCLYSFTYKYTFIAEENNRSWFSSFRDSSFIEEYRLQDMFLLSKSVILRCMISLLQENCLQILPGSVNVRVRFIEKSKEQPLLEEDVALNDDCGDSNVGFHGSSNNSDSLYAEKHEMSSAHENDGQKSTVYVAGLGHSPQQKRGDSSVHQLLALGTNDNDMTIAYEENNRLRGFLEAAESSIQELKMELSLLQNHANQIGDETEKFAEQLVAEISSGERLAKEVSALRSECSKWKGDLVQMTSSKPYPPLNSKEPIKKDQNLLFQDLEVTWSKGLLAMEAKIRELQNETCLNYHQRDHRFLHSDLGALLGILQDLKQRTQKEISILRSVEDRCNTKAPGAMSSTNLYQQELGMVPCVSEPGHMPHEPDSLGATNAMRGKIFELLRKLDKSKAERESLVKKIEQMECYYEALVQELEENQKQMLEELQSLRSEHSTYLYRVQSTKSEMESMLQDMNEEILRFSEEKKNLESLSKELERRAIIEEAALKRARLNYSIAVEEYQSTKRLHCQNQDLGVNKQQLGGDILLEDLKRSLHLQESLYQKVEEEVYEMHCQNVYLDLFPKTLQETLLEASADIKPITDRIDDSWNCQLGTAMNDVHSLHEYKATCIAKYNDIVLQKQTLEANVENVTHENHLLSEKITDLESLLMEYKSYQSKYDACNIVDFLRNGLLKLLSSYCKFFDDLFLSSCLVDQDIKSKGLTSVMMRLEEVQDIIHEKFLHLLEEKKDLKGERDKAQMSLSVVELDMVLMKRKSDCDIEFMVEKIDLSNVVVQKFQSEIEVVAEKLKVSSELQQLTSKNWEIAEEILVLKSVSEELGSSKLKVAELMEENKVLVQCLQDKYEESFELALEINGLKESLHSLHNELQVERSSKEKLESMVTDLTSQMNEKYHQLFRFHQQKSDLVHLRQMLSDLESEFALSIAADVSLIFLRTECETWTTDLVCQLSIYKKQLVDLQKKPLDVEGALNGCLAREAHYIEENGRLSVILDTLRSDLEAAMGENGLLLTKSSSVLAELEDYKRRVEKTEFDYCEDKNQLALEVKRLKQLLYSSQEVIDNLMITKEELELNVLVLNAKLDEQSTQINLPEGHKDEVLLLQNQCNELSQRLSKQILKTEEFKNLSIHLKELKDKANVDSTQVREKRESEAPPTAMQESLRIAFIKEKYETRLQELKHQLAVSKKHREEMLWKLQDAIDDIDHRKKSEASYIKINTELGIKILELEAELQSLISDKREKIRAYDLMKAELDCSMISLDILKELLETSTSTMNFQMERYVKLKDGCVSDNLVIDNAPVRDIDHKYLDQYTSANSKEAGRSCFVLINEGDCASVLTNLHPEQDPLVSSGVNGVESLALLERMKNEKWFFQKMFIIPIPMNEELGNIFPFFNEYSESGNALERVLALELELAEALQTKKKSSNLF